LDAIAGLDLAALSSLSELAELLGGDDGEPLQKDGPLTPRLDFNEAKVVSKGPI
jgi:hypothetical protein